MPDIPEDFFSQALSRPIAEIPYHVTRSLTGLFPGWGMVQGPCHGFNPEQYAWAGLAEYETVSPPVPQVNLGWDGPGCPLVRDAATGWFRYRWQGHTLEVLCIRWPGGSYCNEDHFWILAPEEATTHAFYSAVMEYCSEVRGEVLVFTSGFWSKSKQLYQDIQKSRFDNLVAPPHLKEELERECHQFFQSRADYERYGVPWKRGLLLLGPPGNGKSHTVKALINSLSQPCLYVQSFKARHANEHENIRNVFERARRTTPCLLVLEDLDSLIDGGNRAYFLNELDGFASNEGIMAVATTNHPERLDPAILERPSRFDRKYTFDLPDVPLRRAYLRMWNERLEEPLRLSEAGLEAAAERTEDFSYAYLKELVLSSMMAWMRGDRTHARMDHVMGDLIPTLRQQMGTGPEPSASYGDDDEEGVTADLMRRLGLP
ncbi:MAG: ATP-binding protein [Candidatus Eremiobacterota bacterium]